MEPLPSFCTERAVPPGISWVDPDNQAAIQGAVDLLVASGHTRIAHLTYFLDTQFDFRMRKHVFTGAIERANLSLLDGGIVVGQGDLTDEMVRQIVATGATAVVCANDWLAFRLWDALEALGLRVPDDISLTGIDNQIIGERPGLTTMGFTYEEVGSLAVEALIARIEGKSAEECCVEAPIRLYERDSVRRL